MDTASITELVRQTIEQILDGQSEITRDKDGREVRITFDRSGLIAVYVDDGSDDPEEYCLRMEIVED